MKTTFSRSLFSAVLILLAAFLLIGAGFQVLIRDYLQEQTLNRLQTQAQTVSQLLVAYSEQQTKEGEALLVNISVASRVSDADTVICNAHGQLMLCSDAPLGCTHQGLQISEKYLSQVVQSGGLRHMGRIQGLYDQTRFCVSIPVAQGSEILGIVIVSTPVQSTTLTLQRVSDIYLTVAITVVAVAILLMFFFTRQQSGPLQNLAKAANRFGHGDLDARVEVPESTARDVREVALAFNNMADSLQKSEVSRQEFVTNVSHELKTPMTTISGMVDGVLDGTIPPEKQKHYLQIVSSETKRLSRLVRSMLDISRLQSNSVPEERKTRFDVCECAGQVLLRFEQKITVKKLTVQAELPDMPLYTLADMDAITQVIYNLVDNAVKFCQDSGELSLTVRTGGNKIYVTVGNTGQTIPAQELPLVFDRFHKLDKSRSEGGDGWGLGLYIVKSLVCSHGEDISVTSGDGRTDFTFTLPLVN